MRVAIIGGGPAGLTAAITAARKGATVDLYEKGPEIGRKLLVSGNGRCNISHTHIRVEDYFGATPAFLRPVLKAFGYKDLERFCRGLGLLLRPVSDGRVYPLSNEARSVRAAFVRETARLGVKTRVACGVEEIIAGREGFEVKTAGKRLRYDRVLLAAGSPAAPQLGGSEEGFDLAKNLGHTVVPGYPVLVGLRVKGGMPGRLKGQKIEAGLRLYVEGKTVAKERGDLLFTDYGLSGFAVLDLSPVTSAALRDGLRVAVGVNLLPHLERGEVVGLLTAMAKELPHLDVASLLHGLLPIKVVNALMISLSWQGQMSVASLNAKQWRQLAARLGDWRFEIGQTHGYRHAEAAGGGVETAEVDPKTMQSRKVPGLYFAGEVLDVAGRRGGYNLHFAWASGYVAGRAVAGR
ncbi:MAG: NAD(P)/FAD-dependent oxidoreductase [Epsilonproteobacteria bacterium]|nr:NAD(P)/FAD-dependent oxidoreductase [Campylobacterota bacterium]